jgi:hypothetical protein
LIEPGPITSTNWFCANAYAVFKRHIDIEHSIHQKKYVKMEQRLLAGDNPIYFATNRRAKKSYPRLLL